MALSPLRKAPLFMMHWYAKIVRFPGLATEEYEYRYRCCDREFHVEFKRVFKGKKAGEFFETSCGWFDLREKEPEFHKTNFCPSCNEPIPRPWLSPNCDAFLCDDVRFLRKEK